MLILQNISIPVFFRRKAVIRVPGCSRGKKAGEIAGTIDRMVILESQYKEILSGHILPEAIFQSIHYLTENRKSAEQAISVTKAHTTNGNSSGGSGSGGSETPQWDQNGNNWTYRKADGKYAQNEWQQISFNGETSWYYFGSDSNMVSGWHKDSTGNWYYLKESSGTSGTGTGTGGGSFRGAMQTGWSADPQDGHRYYLDPSTGKMVTGWKQIDGLWYYFNETVPGQSGWSWSETEKKLVYADNGELPLGACIESMTTDQKPE